jgi:eukaryotic-like serine/threonine-protein kinase
MEPAENQTPHGRSLGRYVLYDEFATGGMATVHFGRLRGQGGFSRTVAIKRLHAPYARDPHFVSMLVEEARLAARVQHPNVVAPLDVVAVDDQELLLVMEYIHGESLSRLLGCCARQSRRVPPQVAVSIMAGVLYGLHAAHEAVSDQGEPLNIVHRDVSPQNILVGTDGAARVLDFGVAKASSRSPGTVPGTTKGKLSYMSPEQLRFKTIDRRADIFAAGIVLWEMLTLRRLFRSDDPGLVAMKILKSDVPVASRFNPQVPRALDSVVTSALARDRDARYGTALMFAKALEEAVTPATVREVAEWVAATTPDGLAQRARLRARIESAAGRESVPPRPLSPEAAAVPAPEDESVTVRARPSGAMPVVVPPPVAAPARPSGKISTTMAAVPPPEAPTLVMLDPPVEVAAELAAADIVESVEITGRTPVLAQEIEATPIRVWRKVPSRVWGGLGIGAFALVLGLAMFLPRRTPESGTRAAAVAVPQAVPRLPAPPEIQALPSAEPPRPDPEPEQLTAKIPVEVDPEPTRVRAQDAANAALIKALAGVPAEPDARSRRRGPRGRNKPLPAAFSGGNLDCDPPYLLDDRGIRRIKPECLTSP